MVKHALCPCCSNKLIHHINHQRDYWFCRRCWQEMPPIKPWPKNGSGYSRSPEYHSEWQMISNLR